MVKKIVAPKKSSAKKSVKTSIKSKSIKPVEKKIVATKKKAPKKIVKKKPTVKSVKKTTVTKALENKESSTNLAPGLDPKVFTLTEDEKKLIILHNSLKLQIELVPQSCWYSNIRSNVKDSQWDKIRKEVYAKANHHCEICGEQGTKHPVECHEVWYYNEDTLNQKLNYFQALCPLCHEVKHIGLASLRGNGFRAAERFAKVNGLEDGESRLIRTAVSKQWRIRSLQKWSFDIDLLKEYGIDITQLKDSSQAKRRPYNG